MRIRKRRRGEGEEQRNKKEEKMAQPWGQWLLGFSCKCRRATTDYYDHQN
jgi:hypothetical protein